MTIAGNIDNIEEKITIYFSSISKKHHYIIYNYTLLTDKNKK